MNPLLHSLKSMFSGNKDSSPTPMNTKNEMMMPPRDENLAASSAAEAAEAPPARPARRRVVQAPVIAADDGWRAAAGILIKAEPSRSGDCCKFMVNRDLFKGYSWYFPDFESAAGSPLAEAVFSVDGVESALIHGSTVTVTRADKSRAEWLPLARLIGAAVRGVLEGGAPPVAESIVKSIPAESEIRRQIQEVIDGEVNPGVAGHGGKVTLLSVQGNTVTIQMGGGCQGCSAADVTLKVGIHNSFRRAAPYVGAILDETDHAAGVNPFF